MLTATVSGSFHRHMTEITRAVTELGALGVKVLSPADPRVVDNVGEFMFVASDRMRSVRLVQDRHLESIRASDFLWLVTPDGYVGQSAAMELGFAAAHQIPVLAATLPTDLTLRQYVKRVSGMSAAVADGLARRSGGVHAARFLIDPRASVAAAHATLERIDGAIKREQFRKASIAKPDDIYTDCRRLSEAFKLPVD